jgi:hypothetical protein
MAQHWQQHRQQQHVCGEQLAEKRRSQSSCHRLLLAAQSAG